MAKFEDEETFSDKLKEFFDVILFRSSRHIKWFFQNLIRGFSGRDLWSLDYHLAELILPRLIAFKKINRLGVPGILCKVDGTDQDFEAEGKQWEEILDKMILGFDLLVKDSYTSVEELIENEKKIQEAIDLLAKYFRALWD